MPPQGQSIGLALEDVEMLTRVLTELKVETGLDERFARWDALLRPRIEAAHRHAARMFEGVKNLGWFKHLCREWLYWVFLGLFRWHSNDGFLYDVSKAPL